jgi:hypothetical protein
MPTYMTKEDFEQTMKSLEEQGKAIASSKDAARAVLISVGVLTPEGYLTEMYKELNEYGPNKGKPYKNVRY